jgi:serine/threonine protein kinase/tetratricopeptide (TPR) repeat protein
VQDSASSLRATSALEPTGVGQTISHYRILDRLGEGGMGVVYKAEDTRLKRVVALKFLPEKLARDAEARARFTHEAQAASSLNHPNICTIHDLDEADGRMFITMACIEGEELTDWIRSDNLDLEEVIEIASQICEGLKEAHEHGVVHRDIKPANIMVTPRGIVKVMDFGIAKLSGATVLTRPGATTGTVAYMSPEQARGERLDHRTDIWSLGVVMYEMVTGRRPFSADYEQGLVRSILYDTPEQMDRLRPGVPTGFERVVSRMLAKNPASRYQTVEHVLADLKRLRDGLEPTVGSAKGATEPKTSIAVLPFANLSAQPEQEYFCDGITEEIINALARVESLHVVARTSAFAFKGKNEDIREIGRKLNVGTILEGSVRRAGNRLRVTAQLIAVADGCHLWSERYDRDADDVFEVQDEISQAIENTLRVKLLGDARPAESPQRSTDPEAYNLYLRGRFLSAKRTRDGLEKGIACFERAVARDPDYALAYAGLAQAYTRLVVQWTAAPEDAFPKAETAALKALSLDGDLAEARAAMGWVEYAYRHNMEAAERQLRRAIELNPNYARAHYLYSSVLSRSPGRRAQAAEEAQRALELDPLSHAIVSWAGRIRELSWDWEGAAELYRRAIEIEPSDLTPRLALADLLAMLGRPDEAIHEIEHALTISPNDLWAKLTYGRVLYAARRYDDAIEELRPVAATAPSRYEGHHFLGLACLQKGSFDEALEELHEARGLVEGASRAGIEAMLAVAYAKADSQTRARDMVDRLSARWRQHRRSVDLARVHFALGENDRGFGRLLEACEQRDPNVRTIGIDPLLDDVRDDPRFRTILKRVRLGG